jgi:hypothetical protein
MRSLRSGGRVASATGEGVQGVQGHALNDFKHSTRDLHHLDEDLEAVVLLAKNAGISITLADAKAHVVAIAKS